MYKERMKGGERFRAGLIGGKDYVDECSGFELGNGDGYGFAEWAYPHDDEED